MKEYKPGERFEKHRKNWIAGAIKHPGALHRELGVKQGEKIPTKKLRGAAKKGGVEGKRARLAETLRSFHHKKHKEHSAEAIKGMREFVNEEASEKVHAAHKKEHHKMHAHHMKMHKHHLKMAEHFKHDKVMHEHHKKMSEHHHKMAMHHKKMAEAC